MITLVDVAQASGVSASTVSRALTRPELVATTTRAAVVAAVDRLGYVPNNAARALRAGRTQTFGLLVPDLANPYFAAIAKGVARRAEEHHIGVFIVDSDEDEGRESELTRRLAQQTDGVILCSPRSPRPDVDAAEGQPLIVINNHIAGVGSIAVDDIVGVDLAVDHLFDLGHRRIAYIGGPRHAWADSRRREGLRKAVLRRPELGVVQLGPHRPDAQGGEDAADVVAVSGCTAVIAFNDLVAGGLVRRLTTLGIWVPSDLSVVSFDDTPLATMMTPSLTSVRTDLGELGRRATDLLVHLLDRGSTEAAQNPALNLPQLLSPRLTVRESTAPAPAHPSEDL